MNILSLIFGNPVIAFIILVAIVVFVHELGHFIAARIAGVDVEEFSLGFGPRAFGFKRGATEYKICWLPLGGYVRFYGGEIGQVIPLERREKAITTARLYKRSFISAAGPAANLVLSMLVMTLLFLIGMPAPSPMITVVPGTVAEQAGLKNGDIIRTINRKTINTWEDLRKMIAGSPEQSLSLSVERSGELIDLVVTPRVDSGEDEFGGKARNGRIGITEEMLGTQLVVGQQSFFAAAGLTTGDRITKINDVPIRYFHQIEEIFSKITNSDNDGVFAKRLQVPSDRIHEVHIALTINSNPEKMITLDLVSPQFRDWAQIRSSMPEVESNVWFNALTTSDFLLKNWPTSAQDDKRAAAIQAWQACGLTEGTALLSVKAGQFLRTTAQVALWIDAAQKNAAAVNSARASLTATLLTNTGTKSTIQCSLPLRSTRDHLNRSIKLIDFPIDFASRGESVPVIMLKSPNLFHALVAGASSTTQQVISIGENLSRLITGDIPLANLGGPIAIARVAGWAAESGMIDFFKMISFISLSVGLFNLLPLPVFDGGSLLLQGIEAVYGRPLPQSVQENVQKIGVLIIIALFVLVFYNDILRLFSF